MTLFQTWHWYSYQVPDDLGNEILFYGDSALGRLTGLTEPGGLEFEIRKTLTGQ